MFNQVTPFDKCVNRLLVSHLVDLWIVELIAQGVYNY